MIMPQDNGASADAETGSRASAEPAARLGPTGFDPARVHDVFPIGGYAPGDYWQTCATCKRQHIAAKRGFQCFECAVLSLKTALAGVERALRIRLWNEGKKRGMSDRAAMEHVAQGIEAAIAIEARSDATPQSGAAEGESAGRKASPKPHSPSNDEGER